jgi:hypothetical protein
MLSAEVTVILPTVLDVIFIVKYPSSLENPPPTT